MKTYLLTLMMLMMVSAAFGQQGRGQMVQERVEAQRVAFITQRLELTPEESAKFWPLYNEYRDKQQQLRRNSRSDRSPDNLTDAEAEKVIADHFAMEENILDLKRQYYQKLKTAIPPSKIARLVPAEMEFNRTVLERLRDRRN